VLDPLGAHGPSQVPNVRLERVPGGRRRLLPPDGIDEPLRRNDAIRLQQEVGEDGPLLRSAERQGPAVIPRLQWTEQEETHEGTVRRGPRERKAV
jgi:hypothetical protein